MGCVRVGDPEHHLKQVCAKPLLNPRWEEPRSWGFVLYGRLSLTSPARIRCPVLPPTCLSVAVEWQVELVPRSFMASPAQPGAIAV